MTLIQGPGGGRPELRLWLWGERGVGGFVGFARLVADWMTPHGERRETGTRMLEWGKGNESSVRNK